jgi:hypothetical protein
MQTQRTLAHLGESRQRRREAVRGLEERLRNRQDRVSYLYIAQNERGPGAGSVRAGAAGGLDGVLQAAKADAARLRGRARDQKLTLRGAVVASAAPHNLAKPFENARPVISQPALELRRVLHD